MKVTEDMKMYKQGIVKLPPHYRSRGDKRGLGSMLRPFFQV